MNTGIQISSLKSLIQTPEGLAQTCEKIAALGCSVVQLQWLGRQIPPARVARILEAAGLRSVSVQDFYELVQQDFEYYVNLNAETGGRWLTVSRIPERLKSREGLDVFAAELTAMQEKLEPLGQKLCFHPVTADFRAVPGMDPVAYLLEKLPWMEICLDLFHLNRNCDGMPEFIRRYPGRIPMVHFKDEDETGTLVPAGQGIVRWEGVVSACRDAGVQWAFAEQESWAGDPFACLNQALDWIHTQL